MKLKRSKNTKNIDIFNKIELKKEQIEDQVFFRNDGGR